MKKVMPKAVCTKISQITRQLLAALMSLMLISSLTACSGPNDTRKISTPGSSDQELQQAAENWDTAYAAAESNWEYLQQTITISDNKYEEYSDMNINNPDSLTTFKETIDEARRMPNKHEDSTKPEKLEDLMIGITQLNDAASTYKQIADKLLLAQDLVDVINPKEGEFDFSDKDGYSYHIEYDMDVKFRVDTTEGKPGQVALYMDVSSCEITVTNTTPGKKAPGLVINCYPLYSIDSFADVMDDTTTYFASYGALAQPMRFGDVPSIQKIDEFADNLGYTPTFVNPYDNHPDVDATSAFFTEGWYSDYPTLGRVYFCNIAAGKLFGQDGISTGDDYQEGESRQTDVRFDSRDNHGIEVRVGEINEDYENLFEDVLGWAFHPERNISDDATILFAGRTNSSLRSFLYFTYAPTTAEGSSLPK